MIKERIFDIIILGSLPRVILLNRANPYYPGIGGVYDIGTGRMYQRCSRRFYERVHAVGRVCTSKAYLHGVVEGITLRGRVVTE